MKADGEKSQDTIFEEYFHNHFVKFGRKDRTYFCNIAMSILQNLLFVVILTLMVFSIAPKAIWEE
ncbi:hypothetical protein D0T87_19890 [Bacteroides sp. 51]|nr:hypothetical protein [Bacteroides sp. 51]